MKQWLINLGVVIIAALAPIHTVLITVGVLVLADAVTGIWAALKRGEKVKSAALRRTVSKTIIYQMAVICGFLLERYLIGDILPISKIVAGMIGIVEFTSIMENLNTVYGGNLFKNILKKLGSQNDDFKK